MDQGDGEEVGWLEDFVQLIRSIHDEVLEIGGGLTGEHTSSLYAACARPFQSAFGEDVYNSPHDRAAALLHGIVCDHVFADGNKRTGTLAAIFLLAAEGVSFQGAEGFTLQVRLLGEVALSAARGDLTVDAVSHWIRRIFETNENAS